MIRGGVEGEIGAHLGGHLAAMLVDFNGEDLRRSAGFGDGDGEEADGAASGDGDGGGGDGAGEHGVDRVAERVEQRGVVVGDGGRELPDIGLGDDGVAGEGAIGIDAQDAHMLADVGLAGAALETLAAGHVHLGADQVAFFDGGDAAAHAGNNAGELVAGNQRRMNAALGPGVPVEDVKVGSADAGGLYADKHFAGAGRGDGNFAQFDAGRGFCLDDGLHGGWHDLKPPLKHQTHKHINRGGPGWRVVERYRG